jgi:hypothetical protein
VSRASSEAASVESTRRGDIRSVNHKTARQRKPISPEICPAYRPEELPDANTV